MKSDFFQEKIVFFHKNLEKCLVGNKKHKRRGDLTPQAKTVPWFFYFPLDISP